MSEKLKALVEAILKDEERAEKIKTDMKNDGGRELEAIVNKFKEQMINAKADYDKFVGPGQEQIRTLAAGIQEKKDEIASIMTAEEKKTVDLESATVKLRVTKSVQILDKVGLVAELAKIKDGVEKGVKAFALPHIRKLMEVGVVDEGLAMFSENRGISITPKEPTI